MEHMREKNVVLRRLHRTSTHQTEPGPPSKGPSLSYAESICISSLPGAIFVIGTILSPSAFHEAIISALSDVLALVDGIIHGIKEENFPLFDFIPFGSLWAAKPIPVLQHSLFSSKVTTVRIPMRLACPYEQI
jgi:hypothetical protein